ncbi:SsrA-binding protein SmpB [Teredinibacter haidensis]|uniref:SsrA-binding protein SmpB n=1 Tax=Teredinibacter haidensis TaxID=2731755 RepID=UPI000948A77F|nr:SsrA-binding protein SmpB [Teredinibacter haidensis]
MAKKKKTSSNTIAQNRRARHDYFIEDRLEAGIALAGWEVKALRAGHGQLTESYVIFHRGEAWLHGAQIQPLPQASTHFVTEPIRPRKLLMHRKELSKLHEATTQKGHTIVAMAMYWKRHLVKCEIAVAKGKQQHDKRQTEKERDWNKQKQRIMQNKAD